MVRYILVLLIFAHGLLHLLGFVKAFEIFPVTQLTQDISKPAGLLWLVTTLFFILTGILFLLKNGAWWAFASSAIALSQILIIMSWSDAKFGTIANVLILIATVLAFGEWSFLKTSRAEMHSLLSAVQSNQQKVVTHNDITHLPPVVQRWLQGTNIIGKSTIRTAHIFQRGQMRTKPAGNWMPFTAEQYFTVETPGFIWTADAGSKVMNFKGRDTYRNGHGHMAIKAFSLIPIADSKGKEIDQGALLRFMAEMVWLPSAALQPYLTWEQLDDRRAKATMHYGTTTASGIFTFTLSGDMQSFEAMRYYGRNGKATLEQWHIEADPHGFKSFEGVRIPARSSVTWKLAEGDFHWLDVEVTDVKYT